MRLSQKPILLMVRAVCGSSGTAGEWAAIFIGSLLSFAFSDKSTNRMENTLQ